MSEEIDPEEISPVPKYPKLWEGHFLQVCNARLTMTLAKEKEQWMANADCEKHGILQQVMRGKLRILEKVLDDPGIPPKESQHPELVEYMTKFREEISKLISERSH